MSWICTTETLLGFHLRPVLRRRGDILMGLQLNVNLRSRRDILTRRHRDVPLRRLGDVPLRRRWVFHLRHTCGISGTYRETLFRCRHDFLFLGGEVTLNLSSNLIGNSNDEINFRHKLLLPNTKVSELCKVFANNSSVNVKVPRTIIK